MDLAVLVAVPLLMLPLAALSESLPRLVLGSVLVLFSPGYALLSALAPGKTAFSGLQRAALSLGISIAVVPLIGILLHQSGIGITFTSALITLLAFTCAAAGIAHYRRRALPVEQRYQPRLALPPLSRALSWNGQRIGSRAAVAALLVAVIAPVLTVFYVIENPKPFTNLTQFYLLGQNGEADSYPREFILTDGQVSEVAYWALGQFPSLAQVGIVTLNLRSRDSRIFDYRIRVEIDGEPAGEEIGPVTLQPGEMWDQEVTITPTKVGLAQKVEFLLYRDDREQPDRVLHLWIDVRSDA